MISIVTPTYNSEQYLEDCIQSIMKQRYKDYEHIVVDGGSSDGTIDILKKYENQYPLRWISEKDRGMYDAIRKGFKMARGDIFCWLNSDDMFMPWTLQVVGKVMKNSRVQWITGLPIHFNEDGINYMPILSNPIFDSWFIKHGWMEGRKLWAIQQESCFWTKDLYEKVGGIDKNCRLAGDFHLWVKFAHCTDLYTVNSVLAGFRIHEGQLSGDRNAYYAEIGSLNSIQNFASKHGYYKKAYNLYLKIKKNSSKRCSLWIQVNK